MWRHGFSKNIRSAAELTSLTRIAGSYLVVVLFACFVPLTSALAAESPIETSATLSWPLQAGESIEQLAALFYPGDSAMQRHFIRQTLRLNQNDQPQLNAMTSTSTGSTITIPTLKQLSRYGTTSQRSRTPAENKSTTLDEVMQLQYAALQENRAVQLEEATRLQDKLDQLQTQIEQLKAQLQQRQAEQEKKATEEADRQLLLAKAAEQATLPGTMQQKSTSHPAPESKQDLFTYGNILLFSLGALLFIAVLLLTKKYQQTLHNWLGRKSATEQDGSNDVRPRVVTVVAPLSAQLITSEDETPPLEAEAAIREAQTLLDTGKPRAAIAVLNASITAYPQASIRPWLYLLDIYRDLSQRAEFDSLALLLHHTFNVMQPVWENVKIDMTVSDTLEQFPHIINKIVQLWQDIASATSYLKTLLTDNRGGERNGFSAAVLEEILLLQDILDIRE